MLTKQEIIHTVATHLLKQGKPATESYEGLCKYRTKDGLMCAVGCLIPDDQYDPVFEGSRIPNHPDESMHKHGGTMLVDLMLGLVGGGAFSLLRELQDLHDGQPPVLWREGLADIAESYGLQVTW